MTGWILQGYVQKKKELLTFFRSVKDNKLQTRKHRLHMFRKPLKHKATRMSKTVLSSFGWMSPAQSRVAGISAMTRVVRLVGSAAADRAGTGVVGPFVAEWTGSEALLLLLCDSQWLRALLQLGGWCHGHCLP